MYIQTEGFRRPFAISVSLDGYIVCLTKPPERRIHIFLHEKEVLSKRITQIGLSSATLIEINHKNELVILDNISKTLNWYDFNLNKIKFLNLPGSNYGALAFDKVSQNLYLSVLDLSLILQINSDNLSATIFLDYSSIKECNHVNSLTIKGDRLILLDSEKVALFDVIIVNGEFKYKRYLQFGRGGKSFARNPTDVNILNDYIVVHDNDNYLVQFFDKDLNFVFQVGGKGQSVKQFDLPISGYAVNNELYICDQNNDRIIILNAELRKANIIIKDKFINGQLRRPSGVTAGYDKRIYVADRSNGVIQQFDENLNFIDIMDIFGVQLDRPSSIVVFQNNGNKYIAIIERKSGSNSSLNIYKLSEDGKTLHFFKEFDGDTSLNDPQDMSVSSTGFIYIADTLNRRILKVGTDGQMVDQINMAEISNNNRILIKTIHARKDNNIFTADFDECVIYQFDSNLRLINKIDLSSLKKEIYVIRAVYATNEYLIICVRGKSEVIMIDFQGRIIKKIDCMVRTGLDWNHPVKVCLMKNGDMLIADKEHDRIVKFDRDINFISQTKKEHT